ncbi:MAG: recombinase [Alphaproteobacteria bacterium]|nr:recombinase [Alphaproteobacteria bacterium]|tara:strand:- start:9948 stop:11489 length:1542 start_codon:yes stop_codon:yes gene_type:complete
MTHIRNAVIYCRVSSARQLKEGHGLSSQESRCREYAKHKNYCVEAVFYDEGVSGGMVERPAMLELLDFIADRKPEETIVLIDDISRLARGLEAHLQLRTTIQQAGGKLESPSIEFGTDSDSMLVENLLASVSQHQREKNKEQVFNRMQARVKSGYWCFCPVPGYKYDKLPEHGKILVKQEPVASIIREGLEGFASNRFETQTDIKRFFESFEAFPTDKKGRVSHQRVADILTKPLYAGYLSVPKWNIYMHPAKHEALISFATHQAIIDKIEKAARKPQQSFISDEFTLRGHISCSCCNQPMTAGMVKGRSKKYPYYWCSQKGCEKYGKVIKREAIDRDFNELLQSLRMPKDIFFLAQEALKMLWEKKRSNSSMDLGIVNQEKTKIEQKLDKLVDRLLDTDSPTLIKTYEKSIKQLEKQKVLLDEKLKIGRKRQPSFERAFKTALVWLTNPAVLWDTGCLADRKSLLKVLFTDNLRYDKESGFLNRPIAQPIRLCGLVGDGGTKMVEGAGFEPA